MMFLPCMYVKFHVHKKALNPMPYYQKAFMTYYFNGTFTLHRKRRIFTSGMRKQTNPGVRSNIKAGKYLDYEDYLTRLATSCRSSARSSP